MTSGRAYLFVWIRCLVRCLRPKTANISYPYLSCVTAFNCCLSKTLENVLKLISDI